MSVANFFFEFLQFSGTRLTGGKDSASPRYIFTYLSQISRVIFNSLDDPILSYEYDDNKKVEPTWYAPIIPMVLVNGAEGIGTGWSTKIPNFNPREIAANIRRMIAKEDLKPLHPFYKNFNGSIDFVADYRYVSNGNIAILPNNKIEITELPIGTWTQNYKENVLEVLLNGPEKDKGKNPTVLSDYKEYHTDTTVRFVCTFSPGEFDKLYAEDGGFHRVFKLTSSISTSQMHCFDHNNCLRRFDNANDILREFFEVRLQNYVKRKEYLEGMLQANSDKLSDQARFIIEKCNKTLVVENKQRKTMIDELIKRGYRADPVKEWQRRVKLESGEEENEEADEDEEGTQVSGVKKEKGAKKEVDPEAAFKKLTDVKKFDYLLGMSMWMLTEERKNELLKQRDAKLEELKVLKNKTVNDLYIEDLDEFEKTLDEVEEKEREVESGQKKSTAAAAKARAKATAGLIKKRNTVGGSTDLTPDPKGIKVEFKVSAELVKKMEKAVSEANRKTGEKKEKKEKKPEGEEGGDEFDNLVSGKKPAVKKEKKEPKEPKEKKPRKKKEDSDGLKQSKLDFNKGKKVCKLILI